MKRPTLFTTVAGKVKITNALSTALLSSTKPWSMSQTVRHQCTNYDALKQEGYKPENVKAFVFAVHKVTLKETETLQNDLKEIVNSGSRGWVYNKLVTNLTDADAKIAIAEFEKEFGVKEEDSITFVKTSYSKKFAWHIYRSTATAVKPITQNNGGWVRYGWVDSNGDIHMTQHKNIADSYTVGKVIFLCQRDTNETFLLSLPEYNDKPKDIK